MNNNILKKHYPLVPAFLILIFLLTVPSVAVHKSPIFKVSTSNRISMADLVQELKGVRIVTVGEQHDNREHHEMQLNVIRALHERGLNVAIGFEQFGVRSQPHLNDWVSGKAGIQELFEAYSMDWELNWWPWYQPIFLYAREHELPMVGLNVPREIVRQVARSGFGSLSEEQRGKIRVLSCNVDQRYQDALARVLGHKGKDGSDSLLFTRFCEAQVVWDTSMALNAIDFVKVNPNTILVILAGNFHAWKQGIPEQIKRNSNITVRSILPLTDTSFFNYDVFLEEADYVLGMP